MDPPAMDHGFRTYQDRNRHGQVRNTRGVLAINSDFSRLSHRRSGFS